MQLNFFLIDQKCNVYTDGRRFLIRILLKDLGPKRLITRILAIDASSFLFHALNFFVACLGYRRMTRLLSLYQNMVQQNGH